MWVVTKQKGSCSLWAHDQRRSAGPGRRVRAVAPTLFKVRFFPCLPHRLPREKAMLGGLLHFVTLSDTILNSKQGASH